MGVALVNVQMALKETLVTLNCFVLHKAHVKMMAIVQKVTMK
jgi:hypothetical protein